MEYKRLIVFALFTVISFSMMAQTDKESQDKKDFSRAKVEVVKGQTALVLKAGRTSEIVMTWDNTTERTLDSLVTAPWGSAVKMKDVDGHKVDVAKANVNSRVGLMFTSGTKCVAISEEEWNKTKQ